MNWLWKVFFGLFFFVTLIVLQFFFMNTEFANKRLAGLLAFKALQYKFTKVEITRDLCTGERVELRDPRKRVLAYTMFGQDALKRYGQYVKDVALESTRSKLYNTWDVWLYHEGDTTPEFEAEAKKINPRMRFCNIHKVDSLLHTDLANINGMSWRFLPVADLSVDIACPRDLDSPLYLREEVAVTEWLNSGKILHVMRDSVYHTSQIMGGLWCFRNMKNRGQGKHILNLVLGKTQRRNSANKAESARGNDQDVLNQFVWPLLVNDAMHHDSYLCTTYRGSIPYTTQRDKEFKFIGCRRPCHGAFEDKPKKCPEVCRPVYHKEWEYC